MTMVIDNQIRHYGGISFDSMYPSNMHAAPQFSDPWSHQNSSTAQTFSSLSKQPETSTSRPMTYAQIPSTTAPLPSVSQFSSVGYGGQDALSVGPDVSRSASYHEQSYSAPTAAGATYATSYPPMSYAQSLAQQQQEQQRKMSSSETSRAANASFGELDASRGMLALSHQNIQDLTPRNLTEARVGRTAADSYGFPPSYSGHSSISTESGRGYPYYASSGSGSVTDSATEYSSAASDTGYESMTSRTLPRPNGLMGAPLGPPNRESMMGQFSSKLSGHTQKKHKCKVCDKRFTRPSSLQTHMYSHTGEKPFTCPVENCGRSFSVVSNLRRHKRVHRSDSNASQWENEE
ncbi:hypothetical protein DV738_g24, partial [Chaetothyriales sp. CBS 135597]